MWVVRTELSFNIIFIEGFIVFISVVALESQRAADCLDTDEFEESVPFSNRTLFTCKELYELWNLLEKKKRSY